MELDFWQLVIAFFGEAIWFSYGTLGLLGIKLPLGDYVKIALVYTLTLWVLRNQFGLYGIHILIIILVLAVAIKVVGKIEFKVCLVASLLGFIIMALTESIILIICEGYLNLSLEHMLAGELFYIMVIVTKTPLFIICAGIYFNDWRLIDLSGEYL